MRDKVNDLALDLIMSQLVDMNSRATSLTDKERDFLIKSYQSTKEDALDVEEADLSDIATDDLLKRLLGDGPQTDSKRTLEEG